jgi:hypothetical protein
MYQDTPKPLLATLNKYIESFTTLAKYLKLLIIANKSRRIYRETIYSIKREINMMLAIYKRQLGLS